MYWIDLAQGRDSCQVILNAVKTFRFLKIVGNYLIAEDLLASQEGLCSIELVFPTTCFCYL